MSREVPAGWTVVRFGDVARLQKGLTYKSSGYADPNNGVPFAGIKVFRKGGGFNSDGLKYYENVSDVRFIAKSGDVLIANTDLTRDGDIIGSAILTPESLNGLLFSMDVSRVDITSERLDRLFFYHLINSQEIRHEMRIRSGGSTVVHLKTKDVPEISFLLPSFPEQRRIAEIFSSVDEAIQATRAVIDQLEKARTTAFRRLFPLDLNELSEKFADWSVRPANQVTKAIIDCKNRTPPRTETGFAVVRTPNVRNGKFVHQGLHYTDANSFREWTRKGKPTSGDVLFTREAPFGEVCLTPSEMEVCLGQRMMLFRPDRDVLSPSYLLYALQSAGVQNDMFLKAGGSTVGHLRVNDVRNLPIPIAPRDVQESLERALSFIDDSISTNQAQLERIRSVKSALMADLLTGRRRISINLPLAAE